MGTKQIMSSDTKSRRLASGIIRTHRNKYRRMVKRLGLEKAAWYAKAHGIVVKSD